MRNQQSSSPGPDVQAPAQRRPKNRKAQIAATAAEAFSERGYHAVGVDDIAAQVGISGPALYRHFPNKYALFLHAVMTLADSLLTVTEVAHRSTDLSTEDRLRQCLLAVIRTSIDSRRSGGLYRWEGRYLEPADRARLRQQIEQLNQRVAEPLAELRPELSAADGRVLAAAALSMIGSITAHRTPLSAKRIENLLITTCAAVLRCDLPATVPMPSVAPDSTPLGLTMASKRETLLHESVALFYERGYHEVSIEEIGTAAGINASGVYRHFASKSELLAAAFYRASDRLTVAAASALSASQTARDAVARLVNVYVELSFAQHELMSVYFAEIGNLAEDQRTALRNLQRLNVEEWVHLLCDIRPETSAVEARFLVHAAFGLVLDIGRLLRFEPGARQRVERLMLATLLGSAP